MLNHLPLVTSAEMRFLESQAFAGGVTVTEDGLMEAAGAGLAAEVGSWLPGRGTALVFTGKGHNAGDALVLARHLLEAGWRVQVRPAFPLEQLRPLAARKWEAIRDRAELAEVGALAVPAGRPLLLVDGLLGIGAEGSLRGEVAEAVRVMNALRQREHALTLAVDIPSGLGAEGGEAGAVVADLTLTVGWPKDLLFTDGAAAVTGRLRCLPLAGLPGPDDGSGRDVLVTAAGLRRSLPARPDFARHKGGSGRIGIVAGSTGLTGAARLAGTAAAMMGGGLVTVFCPAAVQGILAAACPPEVMVRPVGSCQEVRDCALDAIGVGPGLGAAPLPGLWDLLWNDPRPLVVDADALNALAAGPERGGEAGTVFAGPRLFTPHPGELARLVGRWYPEGRQAPRRQQAAVLADRLGVTVLAKSARSFVVERGRPAAWNGTGHPLMARGGMGDVLTGFLSVFAGQGLPLFEAAALGSWVLGRGAERYHAATGFEEPGLASEVMRHAAGGAMAEVRGGC